MSFSVKRRNNFILSSVEDKTFVFADGKWVYEYPSKYGNYSYERLRPWVTNIDEMSTVEGKEGKEAPNKVDEIKAEEKVNIRSFISDIDLEVKKLLNLI